MRRLIVFNALGGCRSLSARASAEIGTYCYDARRRLVSIAQGVGAGIVPNHGFDDANSRSSETTCAAAPALVVANASFEAPDPGTGFNDGASSAGVTLRRAGAALNQCQ